VDAAAAAIYEQDTGSSDLVVSLLAGVVFLLLLVVTGGVSDTPTACEQQHRNHRHPCPSPTLFLITPNVARHRLPLNQLHVCTLVVCNTPALSHPLKQTLPENTPSRPPPHTHTCTPIPPGGLPVH
jgi:hypothetical protein